MDNLELYALAKATNSSDAPRQDGVLAALIDRSLTNIVIPNSVTSIGSYAFSQCKSLTNIVIPNSVTSIGPSAFTYCYGLTAVNIPNSVTNVAASAFNSCIGLMTVTFKGTPEQIEGNTFANCANLTDIYVPWAEGTVANAPWGATKATIHYEYMEGSE